VTPPDVASEPVAVNVTGEANQPGAFGDLLGAGTDTWGGVASNFSVKARDALTFPATSRQVPPTVAVEESGPEYVVEEHDAIPDAASLPLQVTPTERLYQPPWSAARAALAPVAVGFVSSMRSALVVTVEVPAAFVAEHVRFVPVDVVSPGTSTANSHPVDETGVEPFQFTVHATVTSLTYQPLSPAVPCSV
jgi:hypothetical protein